MGITRTRDRRVSHWLGGQLCKDAATALTENTNSVEDVVRKAMTIAGDICIYTNHSLTLETLSTDDNSDSSHLNKSLRNLTATLSVKVMPSVL